MIRGSQNKFRFGSGRTPSPPVRPSDLLAFIIAYQAEHGGVSPAFTDMMDQLGARSKSVIHRAIQKLISDRKIRVLPHRHRAIEVISRDFPTSSPSYPQPSTFIDTRGWKAMVWDDEAKMLVPMEGKA